MDAPGSSAPSASADAHEAPSRVHHHLLLGGLTAFTVLLSAVLLHQELTTPLEAISVVTGALCVWLTASANVWNFPIGMANVIASGIVFFRAKLYADGTLQVIYLGLAVIGWYLWLFGGARRTPLPITKTPAGRARNVGGAIVAMTLLQWYILRKTGDSAPFLDALTTAISLGAQWLCDRKNLENWLLWIVVDAIYVPLYVSKGLYLFAVLYAVFLVMAVIGYIQWRELFRRQHPPRGFEVVQ